MQDCQEVLVTFVQILQCRNQTLDFCEAAMLGADGWNYTVPWHKWHPTVKAEGFFQQWIWPVLRGKYLYIEMTCEKFNLNHIIHLKIWKDSRLKCGDHSVSTVHIKPVKKSGCILWKESSLFSEADISVEMFGPELPECCIVFTIRSWWSWC